MQAFKVTEFNFDLDTGLSGVEVFIQTERQVGIRWRAVLAVFRGGEGNPAGDDAGQRFAAQLQPGQVGVNADATGVPKTRVFAHQIGVGRFNVNLDLHGALVFRQHVAFDLADLNLLVEHRAATVQRPESFGFKGQVQTRLGIRQRRLLRQGLELACGLAIGGADSDVVTRYQGFKARNTSQCDAGFDQPETGIGSQVTLNILVHLNGGNHPFARTILIERQGFYLTHRHAFVDHFGLIGDDPFPAFESHLDVDAGFTVGTPSQPAADNQRDQGKNPDGRPVRSRAGFCGR